jgi:hypothetical protein
MKRLLSFIVVLTIVVFQTAKASAQAVEGWGTIKGNITWGGKEVPPQVVLKLPANAAAADCVKAANGKLPPDEKWVVNKKNLGIRDTFVWLIPADKEPLPIHPDLKKIKEKQVEIDQPACCFIPHAVALREGQILLVKNSAPFQHNFKYNGAGKNAGNVLIPPGGQLPIEVEACKLPFSFECSLHTWMNGWVGVFKHPYFAVTDADGSFEIKNAPAGKFRMVIWHGSAGYKDGADGRNGIPVEIRDGAVTNLGKLESFK